MKKSPYLKFEDRLADVVSAIQTLGTYRFYKLTPQSWSERISGDAKQMGRWTQVFRQHPEFFRFSSDGLMVSLVLRRQKPKLFDVDELRIVSRAERNGRDKSGQARISRGPLSESELKMLIEVANNMHSKALLDRQEGRWWLPLFATVLSAVVGFGGVWLGATLKTEAETQPLSIIEVAPSSAVD